jgi:hypothetical protein
MTRKIFGIDSHFGDSGTYPCPGEELCDRCKAGDPARYQGYLIGRGIENHHLAICHLTAASAIELKVHQVGERGLLGAKILLIRNGPKGNSPVEGKLFGWEEGVEETPEARLMEIVCAIYRVTRERMKT